MTTQKATIAIIGTGNIGRVVAANLVKGKRPVLVADRNPDKASGLAADLGNLAKGTEIGDAIRAADIVVFAVYFDVIKELFRDYAVELKGKVLVDPSNPIAPDGKGGFAKTIPANASSGAILAGLLPEKARLVKALGTLGAGSLASAAWQKPDQAVLFYATDDRTVDGLAEELIRDSGFAPVRVGGTDQSIRIEVFGDLHEYGKLGKTVTAAEASEKV